MMDKCTEARTQPIEPMANTAPAQLETSHNAKAPKPMSIHDMIEAYIGGTGAVQLLKAIFVAIAWAFDAQQVFISVFTDAEPGWHCVVGSPGNYSSSSCSPAAAKSPCALPPGTWAWNQPARTSVVSEWFSTAEDPNPDGSSRS